MVISRAVANAQGSAGQPVCGWREHLLPLQAACIGLIRTIMDVVEGFEFVVGGGDFPATGFDSKGDNFEIAGEEREVVEAVRRMLNDVEIIFGDWATTREPSTDTVIRRSRPRLDMPTRTGWECGAVPLQTARLQNWRKRPAPIAILATCRTCGVSN